MKISRNFVKIFAVVSLLVLPLVSFAQLNTGSISNTNFADKLFGCNASEGAGCVLKKALMFLLAIAFIVAVIFLVIGGFRYIVSQGNEESVEKAKGTITNAIIGVVVIVLAWVILQVVFTLINSGNAGTTT